MKPFFLVTLTCLGSAASAVALPSHNASRELERRAMQPGDPEDRGTFILDCKDAEDSCNNICYDIYCRGGPSRFQKEDDFTKNNREQSGCNAGSISGESSKSVCSNDIFYRRLVWPLIRSNNIDLSEWPPDCDEWPPNILRQRRFGTANRHANSLRCMTKNVNTRAGNRLKQFLNNRKKKSIPNGRKPDKNGKNGPIKGDEHFGFEADGTNADLSKMPYCGMKNSPSHPQGCKNDGFQFYMTRLGTGTGRQGQTLYGKLSEPYNYKTDNHYALGGSSDDIKRCEVTAKRKQDPNSGKIHYEFEVYPADAQCTVAEQEGEAGAGTTPFTITSSTPAGLKHPLRAMVQSGNLHAFVQFKYRGVTWLSNQKLFEQDSENFNRFDNVPWCQKDDDDEITCTMPCEHD